MTTDAHRELVWRAYDTTFNKRNPAGARNCYSDDYRCHMSLHPEPIGVDGLELDGQNILAAIPDVTVTFEDAFGDGDRLVVRHLLTGTHKGSLMGIPPTDKTIAMTGTDIYRFADGKIAEEWAQPDIFGLLQQLGALPAAAG